MQSKIFKNLKTSPDQWRTQGGGLGDRNYPFETELLFLKKSVQTVQVQ